MRFTKKELKKELKDYGLIELLFIEKALKEELNDRLNKLKDLGK